MYNSVWIGKTTLNDCVNFVGIFRDNCLFIGSNLREAVNDGRADFMPVFLSEIPLLFRRNILNIDVALIHVSPPDEHGFCSLGPSVDIALSAVQNAKYIIGKNNICFRQTSKCTSCDKPAAN